MDYFKQSERRISFVLENGTTLSIKSYPEQKSFSWAIVSHDNNSKFSDNINKEVLTEIFEILEKENILVPSELNLDVKKTLLQDYDLAL